MKLNKKWEDHYNKNKYHCERIHYKQIHYCVQTFMYEQVERILIENPKQIQSQTIYGDNVFHHATRYDPCGIGKTQDTISEYNRKNVYPYKYQQLCEQLWNTRQYDLNNNLKTIQILCKYDQENVHRYKKMKHNHFQYSPYQMAIKSGCKQQAIQMLSTQRIRKTI